MLRRFAVAMLLILGAVPSHAGSLNIVAVGASNTWGWGVGGKNAFPEQLQAILRKRGIDATVTNAGVIANTTVDMLNRIDTAVPNGTNIVVLQPGSNDLRFGRSKEQRAATIAMIVDRLHRRHVRVIVCDPVIPPNLLQWDGIHFTAEAHNLIATKLAAEIAGGRGN